MTNAYYEIVSHEGDEWDEFLKTICLIDIFKDLLPLFKDKTALGQCIKYIAMAYSFHSDRVVIGMEWLANKRVIFDYAEMDEMYFEDIVLLKNDIVVKTIKRWLDFQDNEVFSTLMMMNDLIIEFRIAANSSVKKGAQREIDYKIKKECALSVIELLQKKRDLEQQLIQNTPKLKQAYKEIVKMNESVAGIGMEFYLKQKQAANGNN